MFNSTALEVAIGMALVYLLLSLFCTAINEAIAGFLGSRANNLRKGIESLFNQSGIKTAATPEPANPPNSEGSKSSATQPASQAAPAPQTLAQAIYNHGLVQSLYQSGDGQKAIHLYNKFWTNLPSYIPSRTFSSALIDLLFPDALQSPPPGTDPKDAATPARTNLQAILDNIDQTLPAGKGREAIKAIVKQSGGDIATTRQAFEKWYDDGMDRAAGWYKRKTQSVIFVIGLIVAVILNVDTVHVARTFWDSPTIRSYAVAAADEYARKHTVPPTAAPAATSPADKTASETQTPGAPDNTSAQKFADAQADLASLKSLNLPLGWNDKKIPWLDDPSTAKPHLWDRIQWVPFFLVFVGWFLTAIAMTLGAPFWFDTLNQFMVIRSTIKPREKSDVEPSKD